MCIRVFISGCMIFSSITNNITLHTYIRVYIVYTILNNVFYVYGNIISRLNKGLFVVFDN